MVSFCCSFLCCARARSASAAPKSRCKLRCENPCAETQRNASPARCPKSATYTTDCQAGMATLANFESMCHSPIWKKLCSHSLFAK